MKTVIVLGNDHTNSLGIIQTLGREGYYMIAFVWGASTGFIRASKYAKEIYVAHDIQSCIDLMCEKYKNVKERIPIIACCDLAAIELERNAARMHSLFLYEYSKNYTLVYLAKKENQIKCAYEAGFDVPKTWAIKESKVIPDDVVYPCLIKPLVSCEGAKTDIHVCKSYNELYSQLYNLKYTKSVILQQYIERDYEISILGCGTKSGQVLIPCVENKLTLYPKDVGLECLANMQPLKNEKIKKCITNLVSNIGYVGTFSVEMMHCKKSNKYYFTEINLRNDGANTLVYKYGVNLPLNHVEDLLDMELTTFSKYSPGYYIWDMHHFLSLIHSETSIYNWIKDIYKSKGFMTYFSDDKKPFFRQYTNWLLSKLHLRKDEQY